MPDGSAHDSERKLDAYLDGLMAQAERASFERAIERASALRAQVEAQSLIHETLKRCFATPVPATG